MEEFYLKTESFHVEIALKFNVYKHCKMWIILFSQCFEPYSNRKRKNNWSQFSQDDLQFGKKWQSSLSPFPKHSESDTKQVTNSVSCAIKSDIWVSIWVTSISTWHMSCQFVSFTYDSWCMDRWSQGWVVYLLGLKSYVEEVLKKLRWAL